MTLALRSATSEDHAAIWSIMEPIIRAGDTYAYDPDWGERDALAYWCGPDKHAFVAEADGEVLGIYYIRTNQQGGGAHVCNCGFMTSIAARGRGVARAMCTHALETAPKLGYKAMQFNFVVSVNAVAVKLWQSFGFQKVGTLPKAFDHPEYGLVDAFVMYKWLGDLS